jgi:hypothetical protein
MRNRYTIIVALVATVALCVQNAGSALAFGWALLHGAGPAAVLAFLPLGLGLGALWGAYRYLNRSNHRHAPAMFTAFAIVTLLLYEMLLPATPLATWRAERAMKAVEVQSIRDEVLLSSEGNPIGMRVTFEVAFPHAVVADVNLTGPSPVQGEVRPFMQLLEFGRRHSETIAPQPSSRGSYRRFEKGQLYRFEVTRLPGFLDYDENTRQPCIRFPRHSELSEAEIVSAIRTRRRDRYRIGISLSNEVVPVSIHHGNHVTFHEYGLEAMYETILAEGHHRCAPVFW